MGLKEFGIKSAEWREAAQKAGKCFDGSRTGGAAFMQK